MRLGVFPSVWKEARVRWLPKSSGCVRPISLLPTFGKILDKLLNRRMVNWYERMGLFNERQFGFRSGRNTVGALESIMEKMAEFKGKGWHVLVVTIDLKNAFNMAWPPYVDERMQVDGVSATMRECAWDFLNGRKVKSGRVTKDIVRGCPQGSSLGPTLWLVCMNEWLRNIIMADERGEVYGQAFADDQVMFVEVKKKIRPPVIKMGEWRVECMEGGGVGYSMGQEVSLHRAGVETG